MTWKAFQFIILKRTSYWGHCHNSVRKRGYVHMSTCFSRYSATRACKTSWLLNPVNSHTSTWSSIEYTFFPWNTMTCPTMLSCAPNCVLNIASLSCAILMLLLHSALNDLKNKIFIYLLNACFGLLHILKLMSKNANLCCISKALLTSVGQQCHPRHSYSKLSFEFNGT